MSKSFKTTVYFFCKFQIYNLSFAVMQSSSNNLLIPYKDDKLHEITVNIVRYCFQETNGPTVVIKSQYESDFVPLLSFYDKLSSTIILTSNIPTVSKSLLYENHTKSKESFVSSVIITTSNIDKFKTLMEDLKNSMWWNSNARYLIINDDLEYSCKTSHLFLNITWSFKILPVAYLCVDTNKQIHLYTFNPYSRFAPMFWQTISNSNFESESWTLMKHSFESPPEVTSIFHNSVCKEIYYDKISNLYGYNLKIAVSKNPLQLYDVTKTGYDRCEGFATRVMCTVLKFINATMTVKLSNGYGLIDTNGQAHGPLKDALLSKIDLIMNGYYLRTYWKSQLYPFYGTSIEILSLNVPVNYIDRLTTTFKPIVALFLITIGVILVVGMKCAINKSMSSAALDFIRMLSNLPSLHTLKTSSGRIFFISIFIATFSMNVFIVGRLSAINTVPKFTLGINSITELVSSNLTVYGSESYKEMILNEEIRKRYRSTDHIMKECINHLLNGDPIVCLCTTSMLNYCTNHSRRIYVSRESLVQRGITFTVTTDSPLLCKLNKLIARLREGGFVTLFLNERVSLNPQNVDRRDLSLKFNLDEYMATFVILTTGLTMGTFAFLCEIIYFRFK